MRIADCPFCGATNVQIDKEHIWPDWLVSLLRSRRPDERYNVIGHTSYDDWSYRTASLDITIHAPCKVVCNNGWMSSLEGLVRPFMGPMVATGAATMLDAQRLAALVRWMVVRAMVFEFLEPAERRFFTFADRQLAMAGGIPDHVQVWAGKYTGPGPVHGSRHRIQVETTDNKTFPAHSLTMTAGQVLLQMLAIKPPLSWPADGYPPARPGPWHKLMLLYSRRREIGDVGLFWPPNHEFDDIDPLRQLEDRFVSVRRT